MKKGDEIKQLSYPGWSALGRPIDWLAFRALGFFITSETSCSPVGEGAPGFMYQVLKRSRVLKNCPTENAKVFIQLTLCHRIKERPASRGVLLHARWLGLIFRLRVGEWW